MLTATLPDYLEPGLDIVLVGLNPSAYSARVGHYFANPRNRFWAAFNRSGLVPAELKPEQDAALLRWRIGFTDVVKRATPQANGLKAEDFRRDAPLLREKLLRFQPRIVCFHGVMGYKAYLKHAERIEAAAQPGLQPRPIGESRVFVVPNPSPANAQYSLDDLVGWYSQLKQLRDDLCILGREEKL